VKTLINIKVYFGQSLKDMVDVMPVVAYQGPYFLTIPFNSYELNPSI